MFLLNKFLIVGSALVVLLAVAVSTNYSEAAKAISIGTPRVGLGDMNLFFTNESSEFLIVKGVIIGVDENPETQKIEPFIFDLNEPFGPGANMSFRAILLIDGEPVQVGEKFTVEVKAETTDPDKPKNIKAKTTFRR